MKMRFSKFNADQSKEYRKQLALKLKENFEQMDQMETLIPSLENSLPLSEHRT